MSQIIDSFRADHPLINLTQPGEDHAAVHVYDGNGWTLCGLKLTQKFRRAKQLENNVCAECAYYAQSRAEHYLEEARRWEAFHVALSALSQEQP